MGDVARQVDNSSDVIRQIQRNYGIDIENLKWSRTVQDHLDRPYQDSTILIQEIIQSTSPIADPRGTDALFWKVQGFFNGTPGVYELLIDPETNTIWHFLFKGD